MKKFYNLLILIFAICLLTSCETVNTEKLTIIAPSGTPLMAISNFLIEYSDNVECESSAGSDALMSSFVNSTHDIIVAPSNLGLKMFNNNGNYLYGGTIVWGNVYICSTDPIESFTDLDGKSITAFGESSTPGIILKSLIKHYNINVDVTYLNDVSQVNPLFLKGNVDIILSAEPQVSVLQTKKTFNVYNLQTEYESVYGSKIPQASIFIRKDLLDNTNKNVLFKALINSINTTNTSSYTVQNIKMVESNFKNFADSVLEKAITNSNIYTIDYELDKTYLDNYLDVLNTIGLSKMYGGKKPSEEFYYQ